jgi:SprB repeat
MKYKLILIVAFILGMFPLMTFAAPSRVVALQIKKQPANIATTTVSTSKKIELEIEATGGTKPYTYTWYQGSVGDTTTVIGNRSKLSTTLAIGSYSVWARVSDATNATVDTSAVSVAVAAFVAPTPVPLRITSQSRDMAYNITAANKVIELKVEAAGGTKPYTYAWYRGAVGDTSTKVGTSKESKLVVALGTYAYWARVTDFNSNTIDSAAVNVVISPLALVFDSEPRNSLAVWRGTQANTILSAKAKGGVPPLSYAWQLNGATVGTGPNLQVTFNSPTDTARLYSVIVTDAAASSITSRAATVAISIPSIWIVAQPRATTATWSGDDATAIMSIRATGGAGALTVNWYTGTPTIPGVLIGTGAFNVVRISNAVAGNQSVYAVITDGLGNHVDSRPAIVKIPTKPIPTATATATATNTAVPTATNTAVPTATNTAVPTATNTAVPTATNTAVPTATDTAVPTATDTAVPTPTP